MIAVRLVLDINVIASAALKAQGLERTVLLPAMQRSARWYISELILEEYSTVLARPRT